MGRSAVVSFQVRVEKGVYRCGGLVLEEEERMLTVEIIGRDDGLMLVWTWRRRADKR